MKHFLKFFLFLFLSSFILHPSSLFADWEMIRSLSASCSLIEVKVNGFVMSQAIGDNLSSLSPLTYSTGTIITGYLSQIPSNDLIPSVSTIKSSGAVLAGGILWGVHVDNYVKIAFSNDILPKSLQFNIYVTEIIDNVSQEVYSTCTISIAYFGEDRSAGVIPDLSTWKKGYLYAVYYSSGITDINGLIMTQGSTVYFSVIMDYSKENIVSIFKEPQIRVDVPTYAYAEDFFLAISTNQNIESIQIANQKMKLFPEKITDLLKMINIASLNAQGAAIKPNSVCTIRLPYEDNNNDGLIDNVSPHMRVRDLAVWRMNEAKSLWVKQNGENINTVSKIVSLNVPHFSSYGLFGQSSTDVSNVRVYPVPFRPNSNNPNRYGTWQDLITFTNLPSYGNIRIWTISGDLVREINIDSAEKIWDVKNSKGETVASGVYIWEVVSGGNRKTGKLMVIK
jgi:hypothetical protein